MIQICPPEILCHIFHHACVDGGFTARSLSLTSRYISSVSSRFLFRTLCLLGVDHIEHAVSRLSSLSPELRHVYHVFVTDNSSWVGSKRHPVGPSALFSSALFSEFLLLIAPTLRTLTLVIGGLPISDVLECIAYTPLNSLTELTLSFNPTRIAASPGGPTVPAKCLPQLRRLHLDTRHYVSSTVAPAITLVASQAPRLTSVRVTDVLLMPGCASILAQMLGRLPLRGPHGWVLPDDMMENVVRLPFNVREFALQLHHALAAWPAEVALVERMSAMDYGDGFVLLPPVAGTTRPRWKEEWLAKAIEDLSGEM